MVNQELSHSCQAACARQLLKDAGVELSEADLLAKIGYVERWGTSCQDVARVLDELHPTLGYAAGSVDPESVDILVRREPWIAAVRTDRGAIHAVIVDRLEGETVHVRDPWGETGPGSGTGTRATLAWADFLEHWHWALNSAVFPVRRK
jgi:predicted double-glycine peptidase